MKCSIFFGRIPVNILNASNSACDDDVHLGVVCVDDEPKRSDRGLLCSCRPSIAAASSYARDDHL